MFGLQFTSLLLALYWPAKSALNREARTACDKVDPVPSLSDPELGAKNERRIAIDKMLGSTGSPLEGFQARFVIAAPLITSLISAIVTSD